MTKISSRRFLAAACGGLFLAGIALLSTAARGDEPACPKCNANQQGIPLLSKIPYVSRLFKTAQCEDCPEDFARIGVDFDIEVAEHCPPPASARKTGFPLVARWFVVEGENQPQVLACEPACAAPVVKAGNCAADNCKAEVCCEAAECCQASCGKEASSLSQERIVEIYAENAALTATLEAQTAFHKEKMEMLEALAGLTAEKAKLESQVETLAQQTQLTREMLALMTENARLKAQVEAAEAKLTIVHEMAKLAMENEQLKLALQKRQNHGLISNDVEYFPPAPEAKSTPRLER